MENLLNVKNLRVAFLDEDSQQYNEVVHDVDLSIEKGKVLALVGESGSGKSVSAMSLIRLLPANKARISADEIHYHNGEQYIDLTTQSAEQLQAIRGKEIAVIFQDPLSALNPVQRVGKQVVTRCSVWASKSKKSFACTAPISTAAIIAVKRWLYLIRSASKTRQRKSAATRINYRVVCASGFRTGGTPETVNC